MFHSGALQEMADLHEYVDVGDELIVCGMQDDGFAVAGGLEMAVGLIDHLAELGKHRADIPPVQVMCNRMTKDGVIGALVGLVNCVFIMG